jgi:tRNA threonylcarbamoyl adenosine modification protein YeaZ
MLVLGIDTSSAVVVASLSDGTGVVATSTQPGAQAHGELLAPGIDEVLRASGRRPADLTHVVVGVGPGPFTGLRVGIVTALVLGEALGIPVLGVCSLDVVAALARDGLGGGFSVVTDARRKEVYVAQYDADRRRISEPGVARPAELDETIRRGPVVGPGAALYPDLFADVRDTEPLAPAALAAVATAVALGSAAYEVLDPSPLYLRRPDAVENAARKRVTQP